MNIKIKKEPLSSCSVTSRFQKYTDIIAFKITFLLFCASLLLEFQFREVVMTLTKAHIAKKIADDCGFIQGEAIEILEKLLGTMKSKLAAGEDIMLSGFGKFSVKSKRARRGRNPQTGEPMVLNARRVVVWKYSPRFKNAINGSE